MSTASDQFERLVAALDSVRTKCPSLPVLSILWMHAKHPVHPVQTALMSDDGHEGVQGPRDVARSGFHALMGRLSQRGGIPVRAVICFGNALRLSIRLALLRFGYRNQVRALRRRRFDFVVKSWGFGDQPPVVGLDFYYGDLQARLARRGVSMLLLCGDTTETDSERFADNHVSIGELARLPEFCIVPFWTPLWMTLLQIQTSVQLRRLRNQEEDSLASKIEEWASRDCLLPAVTRTGLYFWLGKAVAQTWRPTACVTLYEGQPWEKALWWGAKTEAPNCRTIGYEHAAVFPEAISMIRPFRDIPNRSVPGLVLALGEGSADLLRQGHEALGTRVVPFGSFRTSNVNVNEPADVARRTVLVLPEGLAAEIAVLFSFAYRCAALLPEYRFILRCHPNWPIEEALKLVSDRPEDCPNVFPSDAEDIETDYRRASVMLYRGTSAVLYGVLHGLRPVYLRSNSRLDSDPLYAIDVWRRICESAKGFVREIEHDESCPPDQRGADWRSAAAYVRAYVTPVTDESIDALLAETGLE